MEFKGVQVIMEMEIEEVVVIITEILMVGEIDEMIIVQMKMTIINILKLLVEINQDRNQIGLRVIIIDKIKEKIIKISKKNISLKRIRSLIKIIKKFL